MWVRLDQDPGQFPRFFGRGNQMEWQIDSGTKNAVVSRFHFGTAVKVLPQLDLTDWTFIAFVGTGSRIAAYRGTRTTPVAEIASLTTNVGIVPLRRLPSSGSVEPR